MIKSSASGLARRVLALALSAAVACVASPLRTPGAIAGPIDLPDIGSSSDALLSTGGEVRLGKAFMRSVRQALPVLEDPLVTDYVETLGRSLLAADPSSRGSYTFFVVDQPVVNAFAGPGGYIGVYAGLISATQSESELAAVMAHEIAHVNQRHLLRSAEDQAKLSLPATALMLAAAILGAQVSSNAAAAAMTGLQAAMIQRQINFTRENEKEADRIGIAALASAGFDPYAMAGFFERLSKATRATDSGTPEFLRTHPVNTSRISDAMGRAEDYGPRQRPDSLRFQLTRAFLRERSYDRPEKSLDAFRATLREGRYNSETAERYGYALALLRSGDAAAARAELEPLLKAHPSVPELVVLDARIDLKQGNKDRALERLRQAVGLSPGSWALRYVYGQALLDAGQPRKAMEQLKTVAQMKPGNAVVYSMLSRAAVQSGDKAGVFRYRAEELFAEGQVEPAIRQLDFALRQRDIAYQQLAQIQARRDEMMEERCMAMESGEDSGSEKRPSRGEPGLPPCPKRRDRGSSRTE